MDISLNISQKKKKRKSRNVSTTLVRKAIPGYLPEGHLSQHLSICALAFIATLFKIAKLLFNQGVYKQRN